MNIIVSIATMKTKDALEATNTYKCLVDIKDSFESRTGNSVTLNPVFENRVGLSELYQNILNEHSTTYDYCLFIHDDLEIHDYLVFDKLIEAHNNFDIVGIAGSTSQDYTDIVNPSGNLVPLVWHLRKKTPADGRGFVSHFVPKGSIMGNSVTHINSSYFGPTPCEVVVIDGLFLSFKTSSLKDKDEVFDRDFTFHFYDLGMCLRAKKMSLSIGVWPIYALHYGLGEYAGDPTWHKMAQIFRDRYNHYSNSI